MVYALDSSQCRNYDLSSRREWILTNGLGGFAMGTAAGSNMRRYHGHLVVADPAPANRFVLLGGIEAFVQGDGNPMGISCHQYQGAVNPEGHHTIESFAAAKNWVRWRHRVAGMNVEKRLAMHHGVNAATIEFANIGEHQIGLTLRPLVQHKFYHENFRSDEAYPHVQAFPKNRTVVEHEGRTLILRHDGAQRLPAVGWYYRFEYARELERGLDGRDDLFCPCELRYELMPGESAVLVASLNDDAEPWTDWSEDDADHSLPNQLREAAERYLVETPTRTSIIAGYPWFTDWGRDTMISIPGICLQTGRLSTARKIITDYAGQMSQGIIPNRFVEEGEEPEYNSVDASLWLANAVYKTLEAEWSEEFAKTSMEALVQMFEWHMKGTHFGIGVDPEDGLLTQGAEGAQLTWMDAKIGEWVVTPRHGKPVEVNGLWINALRIMEWLAGKLKLESSPYADAAARAEENFDRKFWKESIGYYMDTADPDDASLRPNQLIAMALPFAPAKGDRAKAAFGVVSRELLTPVGLRTLSSDDVKYRGRFEGPLSELDASYHQGTVWPWLMGSYVSAMVKLTGDKVEARRLLKNAKELLHEYGLGGIAEVYDGDEPRSPGGCPWQAWSTAEWLRAWTEDAS